MMTRKEIAWQCRRGMLELDLLFERFLNEKYDTLSDEERQDFTALLGDTDHNLYQWLVCHAEPPEKLKKLVALISHSPV